MSYAFNARATFLLSC